MEITVMAIIIIIIKNKCTKISWIRKSSNSGYHPIMYQCKAVEGCKQILRSLRINIPLKLA